MLREAKHSRSRRTPCPRTVPAAMQGVLSTLSTGLCPLPNPQQGVLSAPLDRFPREQHLRSPRLSQIFPPRIHRLNQSNLLRPSRSTPAGRNDISWQIPRSLPACAPSLAGRCCSSSRCKASPTGYKRCRCSKRVPSQQSTTLCHLNGPSRRSHISTVILSAAGRFAKRIALRSRRTPTTLKLPEPPQGVLPVPTALCERPDTSRPPSTL